MEFQEFYDNTYGYPPKKGDPDDQDLLKMAYRTNRISAAYTIE
jgi:hypothetical protein